MVQERDGNKLVVGFPADPEMVFVKTVPDRSAGIEKMSQNVFQEIILSLEAEGRKLPRQRRRIQHPAVAERIFPAPRLLQRRPRTGRNGRFPGKDRDPDPGTGKELRLPENFGAAGFELADNGFRRIGVFRLVKAVIGRRRAIKDPVAAQRRQDIARGKHREIPPRKTVLFPEFPDPGKDGFIRFLHDRSPAPSGIFGVKHSAHRPDLNLASQYTCRPSICQAEKRPVSQEK